MKLAPAFGVRDFFVLVAAVVAGLTAAKLYGDWNYPRYASLFGPAVIGLFSAWLAYRSQAPRGRKRFGLLCGLTLLYLPAMAALDRFVEWVAWDHFEEFATSLEGNTRSLYETAAALGPGLVHPTVILLVWAGTSWLLFRKAALQEVEGAGVVC